ncbi:MAG: copper resistance D family protein [Gemmatimonadaceae bacterium]
METRPLIEWPEPIVQLITFVAAFLAAGAIGFRYSALRGRLQSNSQADSALYRDMARRAALLGLLGITATAVQTAMHLPGQATRAHTTVAQLLVTNVPVAVQVGMLIVAVLGFLLASSHRSVGWPLAAVGVVVGALRSAVQGQWSKLVNPMHVLFGGFWIGTLFVLLVAGIFVALRDESAGDRRGAIVADMVNGFSPLALTSGAVVVTFGVITAWRHLHHFSALWTTPYGYALIVKLCAVAAVFALGAWNWRRVRPALGTIDGAATIKRSASRELIVASLVLVITAILVSLPSPRG